MKEGLKCKFINFIWFRIAFFHSNLIDFRLLQSLKQRLLRSPHTNSKEQIFTNQYEALKYALFQDTLKPID